MKITKTLIAFAVISILFLTKTSIYNSAFSNAGGAPVARCGAPFDGGATCAISGCHTGGPLPAVNPGATITSNIPSSGYTPGTIYTITATITRAGHTKFGFEVSPQDSLGVLLGTMTESPGQTRFAGTTPNPKYMTHTLSSNTSGSGTKSWSFNWTAPAAGTGMVTFYGAFNAANNNLSSSGDTIFLATLAISENTSVGVEDNSNHFNLKVFPIPAKDKINLSFSLKEKKQLEIKLFDVSGKIYKTMLSEIRSQGDYHDSFNLSDLFSKGIYFLKIETDEMSYVKKIIID